MRRHARVGALVARVVLAGACATAGACGPAFVAVRTSEPVVGDAGRVHADVTRLWLTDEVRTRGLGEDIDLVVELRVRNDDARERKLSPGSFSCLMELDARRPTETRSLLAGGGGEGAFPGAPPDEGSLLAPVAIPAGQSRDVWALFHGYRFDDSDRPRKVTLTAPLEGGGALVLALADPARGDLRWQTPPERLGVAIGLRSTSMLGALHATVPQTEVELTGRAGPLLWDGGLVSTVLVETQGPLRSSTSSFMGTGLVAHLTAPLFGWGTALAPRQLGVFAGGSASLLAEIQTPAAMKNAMTNMTVAPHVYGLTTAEGGLELTVGAAAFEASPFPLSPSRRPLQRWSFRVGYVQSWVDGLTTGGFMSTIRFVF